MRHTSDRGSIGTITPLRRTADRAGEPRDAVLQRNLDQLLWEIAAENDPMTGCVAPREIREDRVAADVERWRRTRVSESAAGLRGARTTGVRSGRRPRDRRPRVRLRAAAAAVLLCAVGTAGYWRSLLASSNAASPFAAVAVRATPGQDAYESWYVQIARAPDIGLAQASRLRGLGCSGESWYCVQVHDEHDRRGI